MAATKDAGKWEWRVFAEAPDAALPLGVDVEWATKGEKRADEYLALGPEHGLKLRGDPKRKTLAKRMDKLARGKTYGKKKTKKVLKAKLELELKVRRDVDAVSGAQRWTKVSLGMFKIKSALSRSALAKRIRARVASSDADAALAALAALDDLVWIHVAKKRVQGRPAKASGLRKAERTVVDVCRNAFLSPTALHPPPVVSHVSFAVEAATVAPVAAVVAAAPPLSPAHRLASYPDLVMGLVLAPSSSSSADAATSDSTSDAATSDAATSDAATSDAATSDAATSDAATSDAATSDAATSDATTSSRSSRTGSGASSSSSTASTNDS